MDVTNAGTTTRPNPSGLPLTALLAVWFAAALVAGLSGLWAAGVRQLGPPLVGGTMLGLATLGVVLTHAVPNLRAAVRATGLRTLVLVHTLRVFGFLFLLYSGTGLPAAWAVPAAWADVAVAVSAVPVALLATPVAGQASWWVLTIWNVVATADIVIAPGSGVWRALADPGAMDAMGGMPLAVIPMFFVPLMLVSQVLVTERLWHLRRNGATGVVPTPGKASRS